MHQKEDKSSSVICISGLVNLLLSDSAHPRVQAHAAAAMVNFCEDCPPKVIEPYLDSLVTSLESVLSSKLEEVSVHFHHFIYSFIFSFLIYNNVQVIQKSFRQNLIKL